MSIRIERLGRAGVGPALALPSRIYASDPCWVPPLRFWERHRLSRALTRRDRMVLFGAYAGSELVGTISVRRDWSGGESADGRPAWFGYFESPNDPSVASALLSAASDQGRQWGGAALRGPMNLSRFEFVGLAVSGHDTLPPLMQSHHCAYYRGLLEGCGLSKHHDVYAYARSLVEPDGRASPLPSALADKASACAIPGLSVRPARRFRLGRDLDDVFAVLNAAYSTVPDIRPMTRATFTSLGRAMFALAGPSLIQIAAVDGQPVGFAVCVPELNEALVACRGRLLPLGWARLVRRLPGIQTASFKLIGVVPAYRGSGLHAVLIASVIRGAQSAGYRRVDGSVIDERNLPMRRVVEGAGLTAYRTYRFFESPL